MLRPAMDIFIMRQGALFWYLLQYFVLLQQRYCNHYYWVINLFCDVCYSLLKQRHNGIHAIMYTSILLRTLVLRCDGLAAKNKRQLKALVPFFPLLKHETVFQTPLRATREFSRTAKNPPSKPEKVGLHISPKATFDQIWIENLAVLQQCCNINCGHTFKIEHEVIYRDIWHFLCSNAFWLKRGSPILFSWNVIGTIFFSWNRI